MHRLQEHSQRHRRCRLVALAALAVLLVVVSAGIAGADPAVFEGREAWVDPRGVRVLEAELAFVDAPTSHFRNEALYVTGRLDNGWVFTTGFFGWRLGILRGYGAYALVGRPDGSRIWALRQLRRDEISIDPGRLSVSAEGIVFDRTGTLLTARFRSERASLDLELRDVLPSWRPGDGYVRLTKDPAILTKLALPSPWAEVSGIITLEGQTLTVHGQAYSDLTLTVVPPSRLPTETACFRAWSAPGTPESERWFVSAIEYVSHPDLGSVRQPILLVAHGSEWVLTTPRLTLERQATVGVPTGSYPARLRVHADDQGYLLDGEYRVEVLYETTDMFAEIPPAFRGLVGLFAQRSLNYRSIGRFVGTLTDPQGRVHSLELTGPGEHLVVK